MRRVAGEGALLAITSRTWERPQAAGRRSSSAMGDGDCAAGVGARRARGRGELDGAVHREELAYWPFTHEELDADLRAAGWAPATSTWSPDVDRYLITALACVTSRANSSNASR